MDPALLEEVENSLNESLQGTADGGLAVEGSEALAAILNAGGSRLEKGVLERMDNQDPEIAESVRRRMLVFTDLKPGFPLWICVFIRIRGLGRRASGAARYR